MTDPSAIVPFHDPFTFDLPLVEDILNFSDIPNPNLSDIPSLAEPNLNPSNDELAGTAIDPFKDTFIWEICDDRNAKNFQLTPAEVHGERSKQGETSQPQIPCCENSVPLPVWPLPPVPLSCSCCQVLREIIHSNGTYTTKLEIHGRPGLISHAILESQYSVVDGIPPGHQMVDFCKKSIGGVKQFLEQYCEERRQAGYALLQDPLTPYYEALCVGLDSDESLNTDDFFQINSMESGATETDQNRTEKTPKVSLSVQRERTGKLTLKDFQKYFHLPIEKAAEELNICPTVVKKICRRYGVERWPYRKVKSIERQVLKLRPSLSSNDPSERMRAQAEIERLHEELKGACGGVYISIP